MLKVNLLNIIGFTIIFIFFLFALKSYNLPFYWDTGAFLIPAAKEMAQSENFLNYTIKMTDYPHTFLLPFLLSFLFKISDNPIIFIHIFSILISVLFLLFVFFTANKKYQKNNLLGIFLLLSFITNPLFISQTDIVYFEIIGSLCRFTAIYFLIGKKYAHFAVISVIAFLIRFENGFILPVVGLFDLLFFVKKDRKLLTAISLITLTTILWFFTHYLFTGWWFFSPERYFNENPTQAVRDSIEYLFLWQGRYAYTVMLIVSSIYLLKKIVLKQIVFKIDRFLSLLLVSTIPTFVIIAKLGYFLPRYIFPILLPFYLLTFIVIQKFNNKTNTLLLIILFLLPIFQFKNFGNCFSHNFEDCVYLRKILNTKKQAVKFLETNYNNELIYSHFEDNNTLTNTSLGYIKQKQKVTTEFEKESKVIYITPTSDDKLYWDAIENNFDLEKSFLVENDPCFSPIFLKIPCQRNENRSILIFTK